MSGKHSTGKGDRPRPYDPKDYERGWFRAFGFCNKHHCPRNTKCYRYQGRAGKNNMTFVPSPDDFKTCEYYKPAVCQSCRKGVHQDWCAIQKKFIDTKCLFCNGTGWLDDRKEKI